MSKVETRKRKPAARRSDIVIALIQEYVEMLRPPANTEDPVMRMIAINVNRLDELVDELRRSLNRNSPETGEEG